MTKQEAIKILSKDTSMEAVNELTYYAGFNRDKVVEQIQEAMTMGANALEKQIPKKPVICDGLMIVIHCPVCKELLPIHAKYCGECGQKLDWTVEE